MNIRAIAFCAGALALAACVPALACIPGLDLIEEYEWATAPVSVCVWPDGRPAVVHLAGGIPTDAVLRIRVIDLDLQPVPGVALADLAWFDGSGPGAVCADPRAGPVTGADGWVAVPFRGGGHRTADEASPALLTLNACPQLELRIPTPIHFNSPDISGDLRVDLSHVPLFARDYYEGRGAYRSDFDWDGQVNLSDLVVLAGALGVQCP